MNSIFKDKNGIYRIGWKILSSITLFILASIVSIVAAGAVYKNIHITSLSSMINDTMDSNWGHALVTPFLMMFLYITFRLFSKNRRSFWQKLGFTNYKPVMMTSCGFLCGALFCSMYIIPLYITSQIKIEFISFTANTLAALSAGLIIHCGVSFSEELIFRGYIQHCLSEKYKEWQSIIITTVLFSVLHLINANYTPLSLISLLIIGIAFSLMRILTRGIWFPLGFHLAWNWLESTVFGLNNENPLKRCFYTAVEVKSLWTGDNGNSGLSIILVCALLANILSYRYIKNNCKQVL